MKPWKEKTKINDNDDQRLEEEGKRARRKRSWKRRKQRKDLDGGRNKQIILFF